MQWDSSHDWNTVMDGYSSGQIGRGKQEEAVALYKRDCTHSLRFCTKWKVYLLKASTQRSEGSAMGGVGERKEYHDRHLLQVTKPGGGGLL